MDFFTKLDKMRKVACLLAICLTTAVALPQQGRITGGSVTSIGQYPFSAAFLFGANAANFRQDCGATIINNRSALSAAHCWAGGRNPNQVRLRVGSTNANSGGSVHNTNRLITHPNYNPRTVDNDIGIVRITNTFPIGGNVQPGRIHGANQNVADNALVWAIGWGRTSPTGPQSEQLRHVQLRVFNQNTCQSVYGAGRITANMICAGWPAGGRGSCSADSGSPLLLNNVAVGVTSFGPARCDDGRMPGVYARVARFTSWIQGNA